MPELPAEANTKILSQRQRSAARDRAACALARRMTALPGMLNIMGDEQPSVNQVARQVVVNVAAGLAGYLGPWPGAIAQGAAPVVLAGLDYISGTIESRRHPSDLGQADPGIVEVVWSLLPVLARHGLISGGYEALTWAGREPEYIVTPYGEWFLTMLAEPEKIRSKGTR